MASRLKLILLVLPILLITIANCETDYTTFVADLQAKINSAPYKHSAWDRLAYLTDTYGPRMWGSSVLEMAIK